jgi:hypothetical protein
VQELGVAVHPARRGDAGADARPTVREIVREAAEAQTANVNRPAISPQIRCLCLLWTFVESQRSASPRGLM